MLPAAEAPSYQDGDLDQDQHGHERDVPGQNLSLTSVMPAASGTSPELQAPLLLSSVAAASIWLPSRSSTFASMQGIDPYTRHQMEIPAGPVSTQYLLMARSNLPAPAQYLEGINNMRRGTSVDVNESGTMDHDLRVIETTSVDRAARKDFQSAALPTDEPCCELTALATPVKLHLDSPEWVSASDLIHATMVRRQCSGGTVTAEPNLDRLPNEILMHIFSCLDVCDLLTTSRVCWSFALHLLMCDLTTDPSSHVCTMRILTQTPCSAILPLRPLCSPPTPFRPISDHLNSCVILLCLALESVFFFTHCLQSLAPPLQPSIVLCC